MFYYVGIPTCMQRLSTWFVRRPDDGPVRAETCSLTHNKIWCVWRKLFYYFNHWTFNTSGCLQSNFAVDSHITYKIQLTRVLKFFCVTLLCMNSGLTNCNPQEGQIVLKDSAESRTPVYSCKLVFKSETDQSTWKTITYKERHLYCYFLKLPYSVFYIY